MLSVLKRKGINHIKYNKKIYLLFSTIFLSFAIVGGVVAMSSANEQLFAQMSVFFSVYSLFGTDNLAVFVDAVLRNMRFLFLIFLCGFFPITTPLIFVLLGLFGFQFGFATMFFMDGFGGGGIVLTILLVWLPRLMVLAIVFHFAQAVVRHVRRKLYVNHVRDFMFSSSLLVFCGMVEAFVFPVMLRIVTGFFL